MPNRTQKKKEVEKKSSVSIVNKIILTFFLTAIAIFLLPLVKGYSIYYIAQNGIEAFEIYQSNERAVLIERNIENDRNMMNKIATDIIGLRNFFYSETDMQDVLYREFSEVEIEGKQVFNILNLIVREVAQGREINKNTKLGLIEYSVSFQGNIELNLLPEAFKFVENRSKVWIIKSLAIAPANSPLIKITKMRELELQGRRQELNIIIDTYLRENKIESSMLNMTMEFIVYRNRVSNP